MQEEGGTGAQKKLLVEITSAVQKRNASLLPAAGPNSDVVSRCPVFNCVLVSFPGPQILMPQTRERSATNPEHQCLTTWELGSKIYLTQCTFINDSIIASIFIVRSTKRKAIPSDPLQDNYLDILCCHFFHPAVRIALVISDYTSCA